MLVGIFFGGFRSPSPAPGLSRHSPQDDGGCDRFNRFMLVGVFFGGFRSPQAPGARRGRERDIYGGMRVAVEKMRQSVFANLPAFLRKDLQKTLPRLAASGGDNCVVPPQCSPPVPLFTAGGARIGVRYCTLRLFYSSWANG